MGLGTKVAAAKSVSGMPESAQVTVPSELVPTAVEHAWCAHWSSVVGLARMLTGEPTLAEDVAQEVFIRMWEDPDRFDPLRGSLRSFLLMDTRGRALDLMRKRARRATLEARQTVTRPIDDPVGIEICRVEATAVLRAGLLELARPERDAIEIAYFEHCTYRETAQRLGVAEGTVKSRIRAGLSNLRLYLVEAGIDFASLP